MTNADPQAVRAYYDRIDAEAYEAVFALFADDVTYDRPGQSNLSGMAAFREFYLEDRPLEDGNHEIASLVVDGDTVAVRGRFSGEQNGERVSFGFADFHRFDGGGNITERWTYTDRDEV
ncbi:nuclear transport factor 2 family protein [Halorussus amylolyticus]|uniref:nuclear transport factor 2 family protein n=1 Tax=Halorussus amylolyticus TaxID=1126242 RepID=UPI00104B8964|nr:nuclear transport factor 2 family protein [Halorussus amylolyticus]